MAIFALGDPHLSFSCNKPMDIFRGWSDYVTRLEKNWNAVVGEDDTVVIPGDISWAMSLSEAEADFRFLESLNGKKIISKGNHDYWWTTARKINSFFSEKGFTSISLLFNNAYAVGDYSVCGSRGWFFDAETEDIEKILAREAGRLSRSIEAGLALGGEPLVFLHYPPLSENRDCEEILSVLERYEIKRCFFGHLHAESTDRYRHFERNGTVFELVSSDFLGFCPKLIVPNTR